MHEHLLARRPRSVRQTVCIANIPRICAGLANNSRCVQQLGRFLPEIMIHSLVDFLHPFESDGLNLNSVSQLFQALFGSDRNPGRKGSVVFIDGPERKERRLCGTSHFLYPSMHTASRDGKHGRARNLQILAVGCKV